MRRRFTLVAALTMLTTLAASPAFAGISNMSG